MKLVTTANSGQWLKATDAMEKLIAKAETKAVRSVAKDARDAGRAIIEGAGFSSKFAESLVVKNIPRSGYVLNPAAYIHSTINYMDVFEKGAVIGPQTAKYIWLPLPNVPAGRNGRPHMTPKEYWQAIGPLTFVHPAGAKPMLGQRTEQQAPEPIGTRRGQVIRRLRRRGRGVQFTPLFVGFDQVHIPKKFDVHSAFAQVASESAIEAAYQKNLDNYVDPNGD